MGIRIATSPTTYSERHACFVKKSLGKFNAKDVEISRNWSVHEFYRLKALITLKQMNTSVVAKDKNLYVQTFDGEADWSGVVNFHCM